MTRWPAARSAARRGCGRSARAARRRRPCRPSPPGPALLPLSARRGLRGASLPSTFTGVSSAASTFSAGQRREHRRVEPGFPQQRGQPGAGLVHPTRPRPPPRRACRSAARPARAARSRRRSAAPRRRSAPARRTPSPACAPGGGAAKVTVPQHGHSRPGSAHSVTFRMISASMTCAHRARGRRAVQAGLAAAALRRRGRFLSSARVRVPGQALPGMAGLTAPLAVLPPFPLRFLPPRLPRLFSPDPLLRARRP